MRYEIKKRMVQSARSKNIRFITNNSICRQVSGRAPHLRSFAQKHDIIIFVSGNKSSNGKMLFEVCRKVNSNTYIVSDIEDLDFGWFKSIGSAGICGATSTPRWLMEKIAMEIKNKTSASK